MDSGIRKNTANFHRSIPRKLSLAYLLKNLFSTARQEIYRLLGNAMRYRTTLVEKWFKHYL